MNLLKDLERRLKGRIEGAFSRGASGIQPVELAEWLGDEMDERRMVGRDKVYAPAEFTVYLGEADADRLAPYLETLAKEFGDYLFEHGRERSYTLAHFPQVRFARREALPEGEVDIETRLAEPGESSGTTQVFSAEQLADLKAQAETAFLEMPDGSRAELARDRMRIGRTPANDLVLDDVNVSRHHAEIDHLPEGWFVRDLGSTNGTKINGVNVSPAEPKGKPLADGDILILGATVLTFRRCST
jgi:hypothetical protein